MISYINHSCNANAQLAFIGDMLVIRAAQDLSPDTEIVFWYKPLPVDMCEPRHMKFQHWGFECDCAICQDHQRTDATILSKRKSLRAAALKNLDTRKHEAKIEVILDDLVNTYTLPATEIPRVCIWELEFYLAERFAEKKKHFKTVEYALRALGSLRYVIEGGKLPRSSHSDKHQPLVVKRWGLMVNHLMDCWMVLTGAYRCVAPDLEVQARDYAKLTYKTSIGEDETFYETYPESV